VEENFTINELFERMIEIARKAEQSVDPNFG